MRSFINFLNQAFGYIFAPKYLRIRSRKSRYFIALSPLVQFITLAFGASITALVLLSFIYLARADDPLRPFQSGLEKNQTLDLYAARISEFSRNLDEERAKNQRSEKHFGQALDMMGALHTHNLVEKNTRKELETKIAALQKALRKTTIERNEARARIEAIRTSDANGENAPFHNSSNYQENRILLDMAYQSMRTLTQERDQLVASQKAAEIRAQKAESTLQQQARKKRVFAAQINAIIEDTLVSLEHMFAATDHDSKALFELLRKEYGTDGAQLPIDLPRPQNISDAAQRTLFENFERLAYYRLIAEEIPFAMPVRSNYRLSSRFGPRIDPFTGKKKMHSGTDFAGPSGTPIYATANGRVVFAGKRGGYGNFVEIQHDFGYKTRYAHMSRIRVEEGQDVSVGDQVGDMGTTGRSTGVHLHYELHSSGRAIDAMKYIRAAKNVF